MTTGSADGGGTELGPTERRKILRQHRDLRRVLAIIVEATRDTERSDAKRSPLLVALGLRLQSMMERHATFEEAALLAHCGSAERTLIESLISDHRRQRAELSLLTKLSFGNPRLRRIGLAFRWLARNILKGMDVEERELFAGRLAKRRQGNGAGRKRIATGEFAAEAVLTAGAERHGETDGQAYAEGDAERDAEEEMASASDARAAESRAYSPGSFRLTRTR